MKRYMVGLLALVLVNAYGPCLAHAEELAYVRADNAAMADYVAAPGTAFNAGQPVRITRSNTGRYRVVFDRVAGPNANVQVSMLGSDSGHCNVQRWGGGAIDVACFDDANGPADRRFVVLAIAAGPADSANLAYAWLNQPTPTTGYTTDATYTYAPQPVLVRRGGTGSYRVRLGEVVGTRSATLTTGYGGDALCTALLRISRDIVLGCRTPAGEARDSRASVLTLRVGLSGMSFATSTLSGGLSDPQSWASDGSAQFISRVSDGRYRVRIGPEADAGGIVLAGATLSNATCHPESWSGGIATILCHRGGAPVNAMFSAVAFRSGAAPRRVTIAANLWRPVLQTAASGLRVRINNFDRSHSQPLNCGPSCPPAYRARIMNDSSIVYLPSSSLPDSGEPFAQRFTPREVWRDPFLFLLNDINLDTRRISVDAAGGNRIVLNLPFESEGREVATACHENVACGWGEPDGNNKPNAEVDNLVIHIPFALSVDTSRPTHRIRVALRAVTYDADIHRAGTCRDNALAGVCDIWEMVKRSRLSGGSIEGQIGAGLQTALNNFVAGSGPVISRLESGMNAAMCQLAALQGLDCRTIREIYVETNGDITMVF